MGLGDGQVEDAGQVLDAGGAQVFEMEDGESIWSGGGGIFALFDGGGGIISGEGVEGVV